MWNFKAARFLLCSSRRLIPSSCAVTIIVRAVKKKPEYTCITGEPQLGCGVWDIPFQITVPGMTLDPVSAVLLEQSSHQQRLKMLNEAHQTRVGLNQCN